MQKYMRCKRRCRNLSIEKATLVFFCLHFHFSLASEKTNSNRFLPIWHEGDYWVVQSEIIDSCEITDKKIIEKESIINPDYKELSLVKVYYRVGQPKLIEGVPHDHVIVSHISEELIPDDEMKIELMISKNTGVISLVRWTQPAIKLPDGELPKKTGEFYPETIFPFNTAAIPILPSSPIILPVFNIPIYELGNKLKYCSGLIDRKTFSFTSDSITQSVYVFKENVNANIVNSIYITFNEGTSWQLTQVWVQGYPWWHKAYVPLSDGLVHGVQFPFFRGTLIEYGNKDKKVVLPNPWHCSTKNNNNVE